MIVLSSVQYILPPGKRPFARWHAQAQPGTLGLMLTNDPGTQGGLGPSVILHRAHKWPTRALRIHCIWSFIVTVTLVAPQGQHKWSGLFRPRNTVFLPCHVACFVGSRPEARTYRGVEARPRHRAQRPEGVRDLTFPPLLSLVSHLFSNKRRNALGTVNLGYKASCYKP